MFFTLDKLAAPTSATAPVADILTSKALAETPGAPRFGPGEKLISKRLSEKKSSEISEFGRKNVLF